MEWRSREYGASVGFFKEEPSCVISRKLGYLYIAHVLLNKMHTCVMQTTEANLKGVVGQNTKNYMLVKKGISQ